MRILSMSQHLLNGKFHIVHPLLFPCRLEVCFFFSRHGFKAVLNFLLVKANLSILMCPTCQVDGISQQTWTAHEYRFERNNAFVCAGEILDFWPYLAKNGTENKSVVFLVLSSASYCSNIGVTMGFGDIFIFIITFGRLNNKSRK